MCNAEKYSSSVSAPQKWKGKHVTKFHWLEESSPDIVFPELLLKPNSVSEGKTPSRKNSACEILPNTFPI